MRSRVAAAPLGRGQRQALTPVPAPAPSTLDTSYVSSFSFYFLLMFGLRGVYSLILGQDNGAGPTRCHPSLLGRGRDP